MGDGMVQRLEDVSRRYREIDQAMAQPENMADHERLTALAREQADLRDLHQTYEAYRAAESAMEEAREMARHERDPEMADYLRKEEHAAERRLEELGERLKELLLPKDPNDDRDVVVQIQGTEGGQEASLFAADLFRMYSRFVEGRGWKTEVVDVQDNGIGGFDRIEFEVHGRGAYSQLKYESGTHRVQRVPATESQGRIHTSAATVLVMPEAEEVEVDLRPEDVKIETSTSQGPGGQSVNTTYSKVILTHIPTGLVVACQDEKSQLKNKEKAFRVLRSRLYERKLREEQEKLQTTRRSLIGSGGRSEKIRTYNFKENRVTDHRIHLTIHKLERVLEGDLQEVVDALVAADRSGNLNGDLT